ncbi:MAG: hypothetical protein A3F73_08055 [Gallionellales bacterium RIFCSPLOWO2_12_FULL_59_22]|nr:MAG: hypothetical protein A3H99_10545 [Gallionellales bacterium RIFCSPLOWO2_02_FULL_59_110]OGT04274.1 MAG: hypothetical protein A2Z65_06055 [Gallionellales bacterium RIFCSPLOWO2_02_58_13]OGT13282.1 MAG: hypothetical protein A3F73_08055 [Gallionellales bacterium RIFCSPLOWO2_12_FULL_59_22]
MNFTKKTLFWVIVLITLSGVFFFFDKKEEAIKQLKEAELKLLPFAVKDVSEFWINNIKENLQIKVLREQGGWRLVQPLDAKGDVKAIEKFLTNIVTARKDAVLFTQVEPAKLAELGLAAPGIEMGLKAGNSETVIVFGERGPTHNIAYVMFKGRPEVYRVHSDLRQEVGQNAYALRDKVILPDFDPVKMRRLEIVRKGAGRVVIEQNQGKWNMLEPAIARASQAKVLEYLYGIKNGEIKAFADENPADLAPYGLAEPMMQLTVYLEQKETPYILTIGGKDRANRAYFARTNQVKKVFDLEEDLVNTLILNMDKLLDEGAGA